MTQLFLVQPTGRCQIVLRRWRDGEKGASHYCNAEIVIEEDAEVSPLRDDGTYQERTPEQFANDKRWPNFCDECGRLFDDSPACHRQVNELRWMEGGGHRFVYGVGAWTFPAGAVLRTMWRDIEGRPPAYQIGLPNGGVWNTNDRESVEGSDGVGDYWNVVGEAPNFTATPSIIDDRGHNPWHGFITNGHLSGVADELL